MMTEEEYAARQAVAAEACTWIGTPYRHRGARKGIAADCLMVVVKTFEAVSVIPAIEVPDYSPQWHRHRDKELLKDGVSAWAVETEAREIGNVILYREGRCYSHCAIITGPSTLVHASWRAGEVISSPFHEVGLAFDRRGKPRACKVYDPWKAER